MKKEIQENSDLRFAINNLSEAVSDLKCTVNRLNNKGNESWDKAKWIVITGVITTIISFFLGRFTVHEATNNFAIYNKGTIIALASLVVSLITQFGFNIDSDKIVGIVQTICTILITLGILNDTTDNTSMYIPGISDKLVNEEGESNE